MEISAYKDMCDRIGMSESAKGQILNEVLQMMEKEQIEDRQNGQVQSKIRSFRKKRYLLLVAVIVLMSSVTVMAAGYFSGRPHYQQKVQLKEDGKIVFADNAGTVTGTDQMQAEVPEDGNMVRMKALEGESLEALIGELQISPYLPVNGAQWSAEEFVVKVQDGAEELRDGTSELYEIGVGYRNMEKPEQFVGMALSVSHYEMAANTTDSSTVTLAATDKMGNFRTYVDAAGREYALCDRTNDESGKPEICVCFTYSDRYLLNQITREHARDYYVCNLVCQNMTEKEVYAFLDSLVTYTP